MKKIFRKLYEALSVNNLRLFIFYASKGGIKYALSLSALYFYQRFKISRFFCQLFPYYLWIQNNEPSKSQIKQQRVISKQLRFRPLFSIVMPIYNPSTERILSQSIESAISQTYDNFELILVDGNSSFPFVQEIVSRYALFDARVKILKLDENKGISGNTNEGIKAALGNYIVFLDHDDKLAPFALYEMAILLNNRSELNLIYYDEDKIYKETDVRMQPFFKPSWGGSPDTLRSINYICHLTIKREFILRIGLFNPLFDGSQDYDLALRASEQTDLIGHIPKVLYHWRYHNKSVSKNTNAKPYAIDKAIMLLEAHLDRTHAVGKVSALSHHGRYRVKFAVGAEKLVSIIIPTKDNVNILKKCLDSVETKTLYKNYEIIIVNNASLLPESLDYFKQLSVNPRFKLIDYPFEFNYSKINNFAAEYAKGDYLLFLNNDMEVISEDWIGSLIEHAQRKSVGAVGAKLYYPDNTIQHAGITVGPDILCGQPYKFYNRNEDGYFSMLSYVRNVTAVTAACLAIRKELFQQLKGFDESFKIAYNDIDLCLRLRSLGYLNIWTPFAELYHHESLSRGRALSKEDIEREYSEQQKLKNKWPDFFNSVDPYYSPNLNPDCADCSISIKRQNLASKSGIC